MRSGLSVRYCECRTASVHVAVVTVVTVVTVVKGSPVGPKPPYLDPALPVAERVADLLGRMTLPEKVGQMLQLNAKEGVRHLVEDLHAGSILHASPERVREAAALTAKTRLRIPLLVAEDCIHGHSFWEGHDLPDAARDGRHLGPGAGGADRAGDGGGGRGDRGCTGRSRRCSASPGPAVGPGQRDVRRGPFPDRRAGLGDGARLPGRRPGRRPRSWPAPSTSPGTPRPRAAGTPARRTSRAASCVPGSCRRSSGSRRRAAAHSCSATSRWTACRSPSTTGC